MSVVPFRDHTESPEAEAVKALARYFEAMIDERVKPLEDLLRANKQPGSTDEYLDKKELSKRIHKPESTIEDWIYKRHVNGMPCFKPPTGGSWMFPWNDWQRWFKGEKS